MCQPSSCLQCRSVKQQPACIVPGMYTLKRWCRYDNAGCKAPNPVLSVVCVVFCGFCYMKQSCVGQQPRLLGTPFQLSDVQASTLQVQQAKDTLSEERHSHQDSQQALESSQQLLAAASAEQQQLSSQMADLQLQLQGSTAKQRDLHVAISAADAKLSASEADLASTHSQVNYFRFYVFQHSTHSPL